MGGSRLLLVLLNSHHQLKGFGVFWTNCTSFWKVLFSFRSEQKQFAPRGRAERRRTEARCSTCRRLVSIHNHLLSFVAANRQKDLEMAHFTPRTEVGILYGPKRRAHVKTTFQAANTAAVVSRAEGTAADSPLVFPRRRSGGAADLPAPPRLFYCASASWDG